jgi:GNAT superfamily N-acetyltransferase
VQIRAVSYGHPDVIAMTATVQRFYAGLYGTPDEAPVDPTQFRPPNGAFFVAYESEVPVAMGGWRRLTPGARGVTGQLPVEIKRMYVVEQARGRGISRTLLAHLEQTAAAAGADWAQLETGTPQAAAIALYRSSGYEDAQNFGHYADEHTRYLAHVYEARWDGPIRWQPEEVDWGAWMTSAELRELLADPERPFVPDSRALLEHWFAQA